jgi:pimeloyl-ACP methyl ester carboxylesterase
MPGCDGPAASYSRSAEIAEAGLAQDGGNTAQTVRGIYEDMLQRGASTPPEMRAPLAPLAGAQPAAPEWFRHALATAPERALVPTPRGRIEALSWGDVGKPGLLFVHGNSAHADWWSFICPMFADRYRATAMSLAGMGDSDWRDRYTVQTFAEDAEVVAQATGLYAGGRKPVYIGHSFGGGQVFYVACRHPERLEAAIIIDTSFTKKADGRLAQGNEDLAPRNNVIRVYRTLTEALARFRLSPPQPAENLYIVDHIARRSLKSAPLPDSAGEGWCWKFDPDMWTKFDRPGVQDFFAEGPRLAVPLTHLYGDHSLLRVAGMLEPPTPGVPLIGIPEAYHHVMIDQPLALTAAIRSLLGVAGL